MAHVNAIPGSQGQVPGNKVLGYLGDSNISNILLTRTPPPLFQILHSKKFEHQFLF